MYRYNQHMYRHNPGMSASQIADFARRAGLTELADILDRGDAMADMFAQQINAAVDDDEEEAATGELSDRDAWNMLADLVPSALSDQPQALRDALVAAFREESARAA
jgi:hypothetical protein